MKQLVHEAKYISIVKELSIDEVVNLIIDLYDGDDFLDGMLTPQEFSDEVRCILETENIEDVSDNEFDKIVNKAYPIYVDKLNRYVNFEKKSEEDLFANREIIKDTLREWYDYYGDFYFLSLDEIIDLIIENGNKKCSE